jgi:hypothetical protein
MKKQNLSNLQLELLKLYSFDLSDEELKDLKKIITFYLANKAMNDADKIWDGKNYSNELMEVILNSES